MSDQVPTILIIDDQPINIIMLGDILKQNGYRTISAENGTDGSTLAREEHPDLILLDIMLDDEDGFEICTALKEDPKTTDIPIIFVSALDDTESKVKGLMIGGVDYITKPFEREEVLARTRIHLRLSMALKAVIEAQTEKLKQIKDAQSSILVKPEELPQANFGVTFVPIHEAGGDFYDVIPIGLDIFGYFVADISGHDIGASFTTAALKALITQNAKPMYEPAETIKLMNSVLLGLLEDTAHITAAYAHLNRAKEMLTVISAGHPPVILLSDGAAQPLAEAEGDILGVFDSVMFKPVCRKVKKGDRFYLYTDGIIEGFGEVSRTRKQGTELLTAACEQTAGLPIQEAIDEIIRVVCPEEALRDDDLVLLGVEV